MHLRLSPRFLSNLNILSLHLLGGHNLIVQQVALHLGLHLLFTKPNVMLQRDLFLGIQESFFRFSDCVLF